MQEASTFAAKVFIKMFQSRYWREYPLALQVLLLILMMFSMGSFSIVVSKLLVPGIYGVSVTDIFSVSEKSPRNIADAAMLVQCIGAVFTFLLPALLFSYLTHPKPGHYLGLRRPGKSIQWLLVIVLMISAMPIMLGVESLVKMFDLGKAANEMQVKNENTFKAFLVMNSFGEFLKVFVLLAILPAVSEELIFRGILMRTLHRRNRNTAMSIAITSFVFAMVHYNPYGLISIFLAAVLLGYIYYLTGSLWLSILAHLLNNGLQIILFYLAGNNATIKAIIESDHLPVYVPLIGAVVFSITLYLLWKNRTPLPDNWSDDFSEEELMQREN
jgi:membrane protease YdiL (CAAX protease family)